MMIVQWFLVQEVFVRVLPSGAILFMMKKMPIDIVQKAALPICFIILEKWLYIAQ